MSRENDMTRKELFDTELAKAQQIADTTGKPGYVLLDCNNQPKAFSKTQAIGYLDNPKNSIFAIKDPQVIA